MQWFVTKYEIVCYLSHYVDSCPSVTKCLLKCPLVDCALDVWYSYIILLDKVRGHKEMVVLRVDYIDHLH